MRITLIYIMLLAVISVTGCGNRKEKSNRIRIAVSILPQKFFVEKIAGDKVTIDVMVPPGMSPATYEPLPNQMINLGKTAFYFRIGVPFETRWIGKLQNNFPDLGIVDTGNEITLRNMADSPLTLDGEHDHHGHEHEGGKDPHIWLDPVLVKKQAETVYNTISGYDPDNESFYKQNYNTFINELDSVTTVIDSILSGIGKRKFLVFHPSWGYFADRYGLKQVAIETEGKEPSASEMSYIISYVKQNDIKKIFISDQFASDAARTIANEIDGEVIKINPLPEDFYTELINTAKKIAR